MKGTRRWIVRGLMGGLLLPWSQTLAQNNHANRIAELLCVALVVTTWWLALRGGRGG